LTKTPPIPEVFLLSAIEEGITQRLFVGVFKLGAGREAAAKEGDLDVVLPRDVIEERADMIGGEFAFGVRAGREDDLGKLSAMILHMALQRVGAQAHRRVLEEGKGAAQNEVAALIDAALLEALKIGVFLNAHQKRCVAALAAADIAHVGIA